MTAPFDQMVAENRIRVLTWMQNGLTHGIKKMCETTAEHAFLKSQYDGPSFDLVDLWNSYGTDIYDRFAECQSQLDTIDALISEAQAEIAARAMRQPASTTKKRPPKKKR